MIPTVRRKTVTKVKKCKVDPNVVVISSGSEDEEENVKKPTQTPQPVVNFKRPLALPKKKIKEEIKRPKRNHNVVKKSTTINTFKRKRTKEDDEFDKLVEQVFNNSVETIFLSDEETESTTHCMVPGCKSEENLMSSVRFVYSYHQVPYRKENPGFICQKCDIIAKEAVKERIIKLRKGELLFKVEASDAQPIHSQSLLELNSIPKSSIAVLNPLETVPTFLAEKENSPIVMPVLSPPVFNMETFNSAAEDQPSVLIKEPPVQAEEEMLTIINAFSISELPPICQDDDVEICCDLNMKDFYYDMTDEAEQSPPNQVVDESSAIEEPSFVQIVEKISLKSKNIEDINSLSAIQVSPDVIFTEIIPPETAAEGISSVSALGKISAVEEASFTNTEITPETTVEEPPFINTEITTPERTIVEPSCINTEIAPETTVEERSCIYSEIAAPETTVEERSCIYSEIAAPETTVEEPSCINSEITAPETTAEEPFCINAETTTPEITIEEPSCINTEITSETTVEEPSCINAEITAPETTAEEPFCINAEITAPETTAEEPFCINAETTTPEITIEEPSCINTEITSETTVEEPSCINAEITAPETTAEEPFCINAEITAPETTAEEPFCINAEITTPEITIEEPSCINTEITSETTVEEPSCINAEITAPETTAEEPFCINAEITTPEITIEEPSCINTEITSETTVEEPSCINAEITAPETTAEEPFCINAEITTPEITIEESSCINTEITPEPTVNEPFFIKNKTAVEESSSIKSEINAEATMEEPFITKKEINASQTTLKGPSFIKTDITTPVATVEETCFIKKGTINKEETMEEPCFINSETISFEPDVEENLSITGVQVPSCAIITEIIPPEPVDEIPYTPTVEEISCSSAVEVPSSVIFTEIIPADPHFEDNTAEETLPVQDTELNTIIFPADPHFEDNTTKKTLHIQDTEQNTIVYDCIVEPETELDIRDYVKAKTKELLNKSNIGEQIEAAYSWVDENSQSLSKTIADLTKTVNTMEVGLVETTQDLHSTFNPPIVVTKSRQKQGLNQIAPLNVMDCTIDEDLQGDIMPTLFEALTLPLPHAFGIGTYIITPRTFIQHNQQVQKLPKSALPSYIKVVDRNIKPKPSVGDKFLVDSNSTAGFWVPCYFEQSLNYLVNKKRQTRYRIRLGTKRQPNSRWAEVELSRLAYFEQYNIKLDIGSRVVAPVYVNRVHGYYPGIIAELPTRLNKYRYLIFFERGMTSYISPSEIHCVVETHKKSHEYFNEEDRDFIKSYIESYPSRSMIKIEEMERVKVKHKGVWCNARITNMDSSIIKVLFLSTNHSEWIYRGSPRLYLIFEKLEKARLESNSNKRKHATIQVRQPLPVQCEVISSDEEDFRSVTKYEKLENQLGTVVRAVAKKSVSRPLRSTTQPMPHYTINRRVSERRSTRQDNGRITRRYPQGILNPRLNRPHACSSRCVGWLIHDEKKTKGMNPLAIPSVYAFKRDTDGINISYMSPCGKRLRCCEEILSFLRSSGLPLTIDLFDFDPVTSIFDEFIVSQQYILMPDVSRGSEAIPIPCVNTHDETIPDLMEYMTERRGTEGVNLNTDPNFLIGCDCTDNCQDKSKCACWQQTIANAKAFNPNLKDSRIGYKNMKLVDALTSGIYECNNTCKCCRQTCMNRVVQRPLKVKLQLFKTKKKGWGTRCVNDIAAGSFICVYVGNILTESYANETGRTHGDEYFAELDFIEVLEQHKDHYEDAPPEANYPGWDGNQEEEHLIYPKSNREMNSLVSGIMDQDDDSDKPSVRSYYGPNEAVFIMDAKVGGNIGRYLNHSCDPNIFVQNVFVDTHDLRFPWVSFFASRHIPAGTELTWNYGYNIDSVPGKKLYCHCEAPNCRRRLL